MRSLYWGTQYRSTAINLPLRLLSLAFLVGVLLLSAGSSDGKKRRRKKATSKKKKTPAVSITQYDLCHACVTSVEEFHKEVEHQVSDQRRRNRASRSADNLKVDAGVIASGLCTGPRFAPYSDSMR